MKVSFNVQEDAELTVSFDDYHMSYGHIIITKDGSDVIVKAAVADLMVEIYRLTAEPINVTDEGSDYESNGQTEMPNDDLEDAPIEIGDEDIFDWDSVSIDPVPSVKEEIISYLDEIGYDRNSILESDALSIYLGGLSSQAKEMNDYINAHFDVNIFLDTSLTINELVDLIVHDHSLPKRLETDQQ